MSQLVTIKVVRETFKFVPIPQSANTLLIKLKDGIDGASSQIEIKEQLSKLITMGITFLSLYDTTVRRYFTVFKQKKVV